MAAIPVQIVIVTQELPLALSTLKFPPTHRHPEGSQKYKEGGHNHAFYKYSRASIA